MVEDCLSSRKLHNKEIALERAKQEGVILTTYEIILFKFWKGNIRIKKTGIIKQVKAVCFHLFEHHQNTVNRPTN